MGNQKTSSFSKNWNKTLDCLGGHYAYWYRGYLRKRQAKLQKELDYVTQELVKHPLD